MNVLKTLIRRQWNTHAPLTAFSLLMAGFTAFMVIGVFADRRLIMGQPAWLKPAKFGLSITIYTISLTWLFGQIRSNKRWVRITVNAAASVIIGLSAIEMLIITVQVLRGTTSHFNVATPLDTLLYAIMGVSILAIWIANFALAGVLLLKRFENPARGWAVRLGLIITLIGMGLGFLMTNPTAQQMASWQEGAPITVAGAHAVGIADGGPGLPVTGWSTEGGDLRIPHFIGIHALQFVPLIGWFVTRRTSLTIQQQSALVWTAALGYLGLIALVTWQALRGQSIISPDWLTLGALVALFASTTLAMVIGQSRARL